MEKKKKTTKSVNDIALEKDELILLTIKRLGINGEGIGFYKRKTVFVPNALPGEIVEVKIVEVNDKYVSGEITKFKKKSEDRCKPLCPYFEKCGGCQLQHLTYEAQLKEKKNLVEEAFSRYYDGDIKKLEFRDTIGMSVDGKVSPWSYRNKSSLPTRHDGEKVICGMYAINSNMLVYITDCLIENEKINETRKEILDLFTKENIDVYNPKTHQGSLRYLIIRAFPNQDDVQVTCVLTKMDNKIIKILKNIKAKSVNYTINSDIKAVEIINSEVINVKGEKEINGKLGDLTFKISPEAFFQLNTLQTVKLYNEIKKACALTKTENVLDLYCGIGSIGMFLASDAKEVRGIDVNKSGIENANSFARINNVKNAKFYSGNILPHLNQFNEEGFRADCVVVDPPRSGMELNVLNYIKKMKYKKIVYVSCNPATLAKNVNHLQSHYKIEYIQPIDMFPQTSNVESIATLTLNKQ
ncbi:MAG: 23S rRNA (uracil(1939)-C(5))-methyltransferase RlmD [Bacilli bacterium]|nr:23S rRNA (uracil(1939)-C(5))-methyltransferase RlmD [Bacilli bacterium]